MTNSLLDERRQQLAAEFVRTLAHYDAHEDMIQIGAYVRGSNADTDRAIDLMSDMKTFLQQPTEMSCTCEEAFIALEDVLRRGGTA